jgi:hypothetical protein
MNARMSWLTMVGTFMAALAAFLLMSQSSVAVGPGNWGPPKKGMVNVFVDQPTIIPPGGSHTVFTVLPDRWLTVTSVGIEAGVNDNPASTSYSNETQLMDRSLRWSEVFAGAVEHKGYGRNGLFTLLNGSSMDRHSLLVTPESAGGIVGWTFRPGSSVSITNVGSTAVTIDGYALLGYQTRD